MIADLDAWQRCRDALAAVGWRHGRGLQRVVLWDEWPTDATWGIRTRHSGLVILGYGLDQLARHYGFGARR